MMLSSFPKEVLFCCEKEDPMTIYYEQLDGMDGMHGMYSMRSMDCMHNIGGMHDMSNCQSYNNNAPRHSTNYSF